MKQVENNRKAIIDDLRAKGIVILKQVHGNKVYYAKNTNYDLYNDPIADAVVTDVPLLVLAIKTADCVPVLLFSEDGKLIGAAHCGWKSAKADIIKNTIVLMRNLSSNNVLNVKAIIGPSIQQNSYEVDKDFCNNFIKDNSNYNYFFKNSLKSNKFLFDLPGFVKSKLLDENVEIVEFSKDDTYLIPELYPSYRRYCHTNIPYNGNMLSTIMITNA